MGYVDNNLMKGEVVVHRASIHWAIYLASIICAILGIIFLIPAFQVSDEGTKEALLVVGGLFLVVAVARAIKGFFLSLGADYAVTNKRIILKQGILSRSVTELMLTKCEGVSMDQGLFGRMLGYGTLIITTGGVTNRYKCIKDPKTFRNQINEQIDLAQNVKSSPVE